MRGITCSMVNLDRRQQIRKIIHEAFTLFSFFFLLSNPFKQLIKYKLQGNYKSHQIIQVNDKHTTSDYKFSNQ